MNRVLQKLERLEGSAVVARQTRQHDLRHVSILLIDDVFTTGSTLGECAKVLKKAGAQWVGAVVFGRTPRY